MMYNKLLLGSALSATLLLSGCGGGSDTTTAASTSTGYFVDVAIQNADYNCIGNGHRRQ